MDITRLITRKDIPPQRIQIEAIVEKLVEAEYVVNLGVSGGGLDRYPSLLGCFNGTRAPQPEYDQRENVAYIVDSNITEDHSLKSLVELTSAVRYHVGLASEGSPKWNSPRSEERHID